MIKIFSWVTKDTNFDFMKTKKITFAVSTIMVILSIVCIAVKGFNFGIDFSGGILMEIKSPEIINVEKLRKDLGVLDIDDLNLQSIGEEGNEIVIRAQAKDLDEKAQMAIINKIKETLGAKYEYRRIDLVGPQVGDELKKDGVIASVLAVLAITIYVWFRFEWQFALGTIIGLVHDIIVTCGLLSFFGLDFSLTTVAAVLTLAGYSVNDTVVTYDRIRENLQKFKKMNQTDLLNKSLNDILSRTFLTGLTTMFAALALLIWGGDTLRSFAFTIFWGVIVGTYSSIYVSTAFLTPFDLRATQEAQNNVNPFGNVQ
ncbi:MAG: protein translocase subunit SecF [Alphaproteobacteria bacterium]|nr:protein translocase subunit SecF [Alphaproteobacteria bacterium]